jgi:hypothetical protein
LRERIEVRVTLFPPRGKIEMGANSFYGPLA